MDTDIEPNDNLLDISAALTTSQKILVQCVRDAIKAHEAEREKHDAALVHELHDVSAEVREIHRMEADKQQKQKAFMSGLKRGVMQIIKVLFPDE